MRTVFSMLKIGAKFNFVGNSIDSFKVSDFEIESLMGNRRSLLSGGFNTNSMVDCDPESFAFDMQHLHEVFNAVNGEEI